MESVLKTESEDKPLGIRIRLTSLATALIMFCAVIGACNTQKELEKTEPPPVANLSRMITQHPKFPQVKSDPETGYPSPIPKDSQQKCRALRLQITQDDLKAAEEACKEVCESLGNYRRPMNPNEGEYTANALVIVWEDCYWTLAVQYRREGMVEKAISLERELVKWGSSWNEPRFAAQQLQEGLKLRGTLYIPSGPHKSNATIYATASLRNNNNTEVRTRVYLETVKEFDKVYNYETGTWNPIDRPGSRLYASSHYDITIPAKGTWKKRILVSASQLEHVGSYGLRINTDCIKCESNIAVLCYSK